MSPFFGTMPIKVTLRPPNTFSSVFVVCTYGCACGAQWSGLLSIFSVPMRVTRKAVSNRIKVITAKRCVVTMPA